MAVIERMGLSFVLFWIINKEKAEKTIITKEEKRKEMNRR